MMGRVQLHPARSIHAKRTSTFLGRRQSTGRESFSPGAAYYTGPPPTQPMRFVTGPPDFAVKVRSENDYGPAAEAEIRAEVAEEVLEEELFPLMLIQ